MKNMEGRRIKGISDALIEKQKINENRTNGW